MKTYSTQNGTWTDERVERLKELWADGLSCSTIARQLGGGVSRCAVMGKVSRLDLAPRQTVVRTKRTYDYQPTRSRPLPRPPAEQLPFVCDPGAFAEPGCCRYIQGDTREPGWQMCGQPVAQIGTSWCAWHAAIVFTPPKEKLAATDEAGAA